MTKRQLAGQVWRGIQRDEVLGRAAQLAYFFFFAVFPLAIFLTALLGLMAGAHSPMVESLTAHLTRTMPESATGLVTQTIHYSLAHSGSGKAAFGIVLALLSASSGMAAMIQTLNAVFEAQEERSLLRQRWTALWLTVAVGVLICVAIFLITVGGQVAQAVAGGALVRIWRVAQYPVALVFLLIAFSVVYYFAPNIEHARWRWVTPGAVAGVVLWAIASFGLRAYLHSFDTYTSDYGSMGAVMVLLLWFYLTGLAFLVGGEIDAAIERAAHGRLRGQRGAESTPQRAA